jgi:hypothetical protein
VERTHEKIVGLWTLATNIEKLKQIPKLAMDVTAYLARSQFSEHDTHDGAAHRDGGIDNLDVSLFDQYLSCFETELLDFFFGYGFTALELSDLAI